MEEKSINKSKWVYFKFCTRCKEYFKEHSFRGVYCKDCKREIDAAYRLRRKKSLPAEEIVEDNESKRNTLF